VEICCFTDLRVFGVSGCFTVFSATCEKITSYLGFFVENAWGTWADRHLGVSTEDILGRLLLRIFAF
jgi:hypothetical protein